MSTTVEPTTEIRPFHCEFPDERLADLRRRIEATRWPGQELVDDRSQGGWAGAATAATGAFGGIVLVNVTVVAALAYSIAGSGGGGLTSGLNDLSWALQVLTSFPAAMVLMAGTFGLWRAQIISTTTYWSIFPAWVLVVIGSTTWARNGLWAADGAYLQFVTPIVFAVMITCFSGLLTMRVSTAEAPERAAVTAG